MTVLKFSCGCSFHATETEGKTSIDFDPVKHELDLNCQKTWDLISDGNTKGCFQLETRLGKSVAKKLKPENIEQLSALISILRPGCLQAYRDGKNVTNHYIDRKNGQESVDYYHPMLENALKSTYGEMIYQEQAMQIAKEIAGFDLQQADNLRKAIGKKQPEEMAKLKKKFIKGSAKLKLVTKEQAEEIFGWIEKSQRYSFNKSHAVSYAMNAYLSAYAKAHFPRVFFASYLRFAKDKIDPKIEIKQLVQNASEMDITVHLPDLRVLNEYFVLHDKKIYFGLTDLKGFGGSMYKKLKIILEEDNIDLNDLNWHQTVLKVMTRLSSTGVKALIQAGALDYFGLTRTKMMFEYGLINDLTAKEQEHALSTCLNYESLKDIIYCVIEKPRMSSKRKEKLLGFINTIDNPPYVLEDSPEWIADNEEEYLGCSITCSKVDMYDVSMTNTICKDFNNSLLNEIVVALQIDNVGVIKTKKGKNPGAKMAFVEGSDSSGSIDSIVFFPEQFSTYSSILFENNVIVIQGSKNRDGDSLIVEKAYLPKN
jgi:DNA polymerase-3 subunit alpha